jgi:hypothetical protein
MEEVGFEPTKSKLAGFTVQHVCPLRHSSTNGGNTIQV